MMGTARPHLSEHCPRQPAASLDDQISSPLPLTWLRSTVMLSHVYSRRCSPLHPVPQHLSFDHGVPLGPLAPWAHALKNTLLRARTCPVTRLMIQARPFPTATLSHAHLLAAPLHAVPQHLG